MEPSPEVEKVASLDLVHGEAGKGRVLEDVLLEEGAALVQVAEADALAFLAVADEVGASLGLEVGGGVLGEGQGGRLGSLLVDEGADILPGLLLAGEAGGQATALAVLPEVVEVVDLAVLAPVGLGVLLLGSHTPPRSESNLSPVGLRIRKSPGHRQGLTPY